MEGIEGNAFLLCFKHLAYLPTYLPKSTNVT